MYNIYALTLNWYVTQLNWIDETKGGPGRQKGDPGDKRGTRETKGGPGRGRKDRCSSLASVMRKNWILWKRLPQKEKIEKLGPMAKIGSHGQNWVPWPKLGPIGKIGSHGQNWVPWAKLGPMAKIGSHRQNWVPWAKLGPMGKIGSHGQNWVPSAKLGPLWKWSQGGKNDGPGNTGSRPTVSREYCVPPYCLPGILGPPYQFRINTNRSPTFSTNIIEASPLPRGHQETSPRYRNPTVYKLCAIQLWWRRRRGRDHLIVSDMYSSWYRDPEPAKQVLPSGVDPNYSGSPENRVVTFPETRIILGVVPIQDARNVGSIHTLPTVVLPETDKNRVVILPESGILSHCLGLCYDPKMC
jgi:hypothetical protein